MERQPKRRTGGIETMLTVPQAAEIKGVSENGIRIAIREKRLPAQRVGPIYLIARKDLDAWVVVGHRPKKKPDS